MGVGSRAASMSLRTNGMPDPGARGGMPRQPSEEAQPETFCNSPPLPGAEKYMEILPFRAPVQLLYYYIFKLLFLKYFLNILPISLLHFYKS